MAKPNGSKTRHKNAMLHLIEQGEDGIHGTQNVLARIWRIILYKSFMTGGKWYRLITNYQERQLRLQTKRAGGNIKGNLSRRLAEDRITWTNLMRGIDILGFEEVELVMTCKKRGQEDIVVPMTLRLDQSDREEDDLQDLIDD